MIPVAESSMARNVVLYVLTAWNPGHERPSRDQNDSANRLLYHRLVERGLQPIRAVGADRDAGLCAGQFRRRLSSGASGRLVGGVVAS
jgi:hypothetical protein